MTLCLACLWRVILFQPSWLSTILIYGGLLSLEYVPLVLALKHDNGEVAPMIIRTVSDSVYGLFYITSY